MLENSQAGFAGWWSVPLYQGTRVVIKVSKTGRIKDWPYSIKKCEGARRVSCGPEGRITKRVPWKKRRTKKRACYV
jgi:hypothetical protein